MIKDDTKIEHICRNGTHISCDRADLKCDVVILSDSLHLKGELMADMAEFGAWHRSEIWEHLSSFAGYDTIRYDIEYV